MTTNQAIGYAFWKYETFPTIFGGTFTHIMDDGRVKVPSFGCVKPIAIYSVEAGKKIQAKIDKIARAHRNESNDLEIKNGKAVAELLGLKFLSMRITP